MSKVAITGNASGTGVFTIASPNSNTDRTLNLPDNSGTVLTSASDLVGVTGVGKVLQVVQADTTAVTSLADDAITQVVSLNITPYAASSRFLLMAYTSLGNGSSSPNARIFFRRAISGGATTDIGSFTDGARSGGLSGVEVNGPINSEAMFNVSAQFIDAPATTSQITYGLVVGCRDGGVVVNRVGSTADSDWATRTHTTIIVMEIAA
jgi:hypothetical protein